MTDPRLAQDDLDRRIDAALRRRFEPPLGLETLSTRLRPARRARLRPWLLAAAAASAAIVLARSWPPGTSREEPRAPLVVAERGAPLRADEPFCRLIGPLVDGEPRLGSMHTPDLARLYGEMDACQQGGGDPACWAGDFLAERLSESYGQEIEVRPEAAGQLHGPFGSDQWPTATIVTATSDQLTTVLVADRVSTLDCCVEPRLPAESGLHLFTWRLGDVVLSEITPFDEPRLLAYFE